MSTSQRAVMLCGHDVICRYNCVIHVWSH